MSRDPENTTPAGLAGEDRWLAAVCLLAVAGTHLPLIAGHVQEAPVIGVGFATLVAGSLLLAIVVTAQATARTWGAIALLDASALTAYLISRTVGLPRIGDDVGNWLDPLSFPALAAEMIGLAVALRALSALRAERSGTGHSHARQDRWDESGCLTGSSQPLTSRR